MKLIKDEFRGKWKAGVDRKVKIERKLRWLQKLYGEIDMGKEVGVDRKAGWGKLG